MKLLYGLDGRPPPSLPQGTLAPPDWQAWAAAAYQHVLDPCQYPLSTEQVCKTCRTALPLAYTTARSQAWHNSFISTCLRMICINLVAQTLALPPAEQQRYVEYLRGHIFGQAPVPPDFEELQVHIVKCRSSMLSRSSMLHSPNPVRQSRNIHVEPQQVLVLMHGSTCNYTLAAGQPGCAEPRAAAAAAPAASRRAAQSPEQQPADGQC